MIVDTSEKVSFCVDQKQIKLELILLFISILFSVIERSWVVLFRWCGFSSGNLIRPKIVFDGSTISSF